MADYPHSYKTIPALLDSAGYGTKSWANPTSKNDFFEREKDYFKYYDYESVPIEQLVKDNPFEGSENYHDKYDYHKDNNQTDVVYGTRKMDGSIRLASGRHRIKALANAGYTHAYIPIHEEILPDEWALRETYYTANSPKILNGIATTLPSFMGHHSPEYIKRLQKLFRQKAKSLR